MDLCDWERILAIPKFCRFDRSKGLNNTSGLLSFSAYYPRSVLRTVSTSQLPQLQFIETISFTDRSSHLSLVPLLATEASLAMETVKQTILNIGNLLTRNSSESILTVHTICLSVFLSQATLLTSVLLLNNDRRTMKYYYTLCLERFDAFGC